MRRLSALVVALTAALAAVPAPVLACGGCFIPASSSPVVQDAERILFVRDAQTKLTRVWVEIRYNGPGDDFGWVLPLPKVPKVGVGSSYLFDRLDLATAPRFDTQVGGSENCGRAVGGGDVGGGCGAMDESASAGSFRLTAPEAADGPNGKVQVLEHDQVGPYDYQILAAQDAKALLDWLAEHKYQLPAAAKPVIDSHVQKGDVFVAVRLKNGATVKEIKPIALEMADAEPCVPLRLTSIAAVDNMTVVTYIAGPGRAVPKNYLHVQVNPLRINWFDGATNYGQVLAEAIDSGAGRAFATEFAGTLPDNVEIPQPFGGTSQEPLLDLARLDTKPFGFAENVAQLVSVLRSKDFPVVADTAAILEKHTGLAKKFGKDGALVQFWTDVHEGTAGLGEQKVDGQAVAADLETEFAGPVREMLPLVRAQARVSRLALRISPDEMTKDPVFAFHAGLPDVDRVRKAQLNQVCRAGDWNQDAWRLTLDGMGSYVVANTTGSQSQFGQLVPNNANDPRFKPAPAALKIELLDETGEPRAIHPDDVELVDTAIAGAVWGKPSLPAELVLKPAPAAWTPPKSDALFQSNRDDGDGCTLGRTAQGPARLGLLALLGVGVLGLARRRRSR